MISERLWRIVCLIIGHRTRYAMDGGVLCIRCRNFDPEGTPTTHT